MRINLVVLFILFLRITFAQINTVPLGLPDYPFIHYDHNCFELVNDNSEYKTLYAKFDTLLREGSNRINIVHIGGSHIQADIYTHRMRQELQSFFPGVLGARGFFFPYKIAKTNSPSNLKISYTGEWTTCKNTQPEPEFTLGLSGITSALIRDTAIINIIADYDSATRYIFNRVRVYCNAVSDSCVPMFMPVSLVNSYICNKEAQYIQYNLNTSIDSLNIKVFRNDPAHPFELYGISLENDDPGITYNAIGVNGAMLKSYLRSSLFAQQLKSLEPDWIIISIGTNEGNTRNFDSVSYRGNYIRMINVIREYAPDAALLLTVPNDSYLLKKYVNHNTSLIRGIIYELAKQYECGVWDFYTVMGGLNSAKTWFNHGLMAKDHIHFNKPGYLLKGDLFYSAFIESWMRSDQER